MSDDMKMLLTATRSRIAMNPPRSKAFTLASLGLLCYPLALLSLLGLPLLLIVFLLLGVIVSIVAVFVAVGEFRRQKSDPKNSPEKRVIRAGLMMGVAGWTIMPVSLVALFLMFSSSTISNDKAALVEGMHSIAFSAKVYKARATPGPDGLRCYDGFVIPESFRALERGTCELVSVACGRITLRAISNADPGNTITVDIDDTGELVNWRFGGEFRE